MYSRLTLTSQTEHPQVRAQRGGHFLTDETVAGSANQGEVAPSEPENTTAGGPSTDDPRGSLREFRKNLLIWVAIGFLAPAPLLLWLLHRTGSLEGSVFTVRGTLPVKLVSAFFIWLATWVVARREKRSMSDYGIPARQAFGLRFWEGCLWAFATLSSVLLLLSVKGDFRIESVVLSGAAITRYALAWGAVFVAVAVSEEFAFRGYWLFALARRIRFWKAAVFLSTVFAVAHLGNHGENMLGIVQVFAIGMLFCLMVRRTGTLWFALGFHAAWDWAETFFYGTPDSGLLGDGRLLNSSVQGPNWLSGGSAGPEGSVLAFLMILVCGALIHVRFPRAVYPDQPS